ncbi:MAG: divalent-cation tolerance protein CutA [Candidatus Omnitrophica bacterium]|nr:divalent-cation tolerance protein CutA [Candidatus Omnitrophota bacterium]
MDYGLIVVLVTCPSQRSAKQLATALVSTRLAACVNVLPRAQSIFRWKGKVERASESLLIIKTSARRFPALMRAVRAHHPYEIPEIIALPIVKGFRPYLAWVRNSVS